MNLLSRRKRPLTVWELPSLMTSVHEHRQAPAKKGKDRGHFAAVLSFVHRNRFAVASQIQRRFKPHIKSDRSARRHLAEMQSLGWLDVVPTLRGSPLWPKVYFVTGAGRNRLRAEYDRQGGQRPQLVSDRKRSEGWSVTHVLHELFITEFLLMLREATDVRDEIDLGLVQRRSLPKQNGLQFPMRGRKQRLKPDAMFVFKTGGGGMMCCFLEVDNGTMGVKQMRAKLERYRLWSQSQPGSEFLKQTYTKMGAKRAGNSFRILFVAGDRVGHTEGTRRRLLTELCLEQSPEMMNRLWVTGMEGLGCADGLNGRIWRCLKDARQFGITSEEQLEREAPRRTLFPVPSF